MRQQHTRFKDAPWYPKQEENIIIGGAGGIGSWTSLLLSRAGFKPIVYDFDVLEEHNIGGQMYPKKLIGKNKVEALQQVIKEYSDDVITTFNEKVTPDTISHKFVISAFDNMEARKNMFNSWVALYGLDPEAIFIDGRLTAEQMWIYCVRGGDALRIADYAELLFDDSEIPDAPCTMKQTSHAAAMIASHIVGFFTNHYTNVQEKDNTRVVPFEWEYFIPMDMLNINS